jgi:FHA domain
MAHQLVFTSETGKSRTYPVAGDPITIGRHPKNTVVLNDERVSIYHAEVTVKDGATLVRDLGSSNGTKVNRKRVKETTLAEGDEVRFGPIVCHFRGEKWSEPNAAVPKNGVPPPALEKAAPQEAEPLLERVQRSLLESRYFMLSLVLHLVLVILAGSIVLFKAALEPPDFVAEGSDGFIAATDDLAPPPALPADAVPTAAFTPQIPNNVPKIDVISTTSSATDFKIAPPEMLLQIEPNAADLARTAARLRGTSGFIGNLPGTMDGRMGAGRARAMALNNMKRKSEQAVLRGLAWLAKNQNADGSWGDENQGAMTGFGLLCFLGHGELQDSPQFGRTVGKALEWVYENGTKNEGRLNMAKEFNQTGVYEHAICTYAIGEYYTMTRDRRVIALFTQAIQHIIQGQGPGGGWMYSYDGSADDLSVSGWQIQALKAAHLSQLKIAGVDQALDKALNYLERVRGPKGGYGYRFAADEYSLTGVGLLCQLFWKTDRKTLTKGMDWVLEETEKNKPVKYAGDSADLYAWYYQTQACLMFGGEAWNKWNGWFQDEICDAQNPDGSWPAPGGRNVVGPQYQDNITGAVYRTSLCILMLEVFYRYMPTTRG